MFLFCPAGPLTRKLNPPGELHGLRFVLTPSLPNRIARAKRALRDFLATVLRGLPSRAG